MNPLIHPVLLRYLPSITPIGPVEAAIQAVGRDRAALDGVLAPYISNDAVRAACVTDLVMALAVSAPAPAGPAPAAGALPVGQAHLVVTLPPAPALQWAGTQPAATGPAQVTGPTWPRWLGWAAILAVLLAGVAVLFSVLIYQGGATTAQLGSAVTGLTGTITSTAAATQAKVGAIGTALETQIDAAAIETQAYVLTASKEVKDTVAAAAAVHAASVAKVRAAVRGVYNDMPSTSGLATEASIALLRADLKKVKTELRITDDPTAGTSH